MFILSNHKRQTPTKNKTIPQQTNNHTRRIPKKNIKNQHIYK